MSVNLNQPKLEAAFLSVPGGDLVDKLIARLQAVPQMKQLFGDAKTGSWANYNRFDWTVRQLPAINIFEAGSESQSSDNGYLNGTIQIQVYWPSAFRRDETARVPNFFKGVLQSFFSSRYVSSMLDELYSITRAEKVYGLNELGKTLTWSPNVEGITDSELTPMTILDVGYRIDLRAWDRALEFMGRTRGDPFEVTLENLNEVFGEIDGVDDNGTTVVVIPVDFDTNSGDE